MKKGLLTLKMKLFCAIGMLILVMAMVGCEKEFEYPMNSDFSLTGYVDKKIFKVGEEFKIEAELKNLTKDKYSIDYGADKLDTELIDIEIVRTGEQLGNKIVAGFGMVTDLKREGIVRRSKICTIDKKGKYDILIFSAFSVLKPKTNERKNYSYHFEPIHITVE